MNEEQIKVLADYFTGPDLVLCSIALVGPKESTAYQRAIRFMKLRTAFGVPAECDSPVKAAGYISTRVRKC